MLYNFSKGEFVSEIVIVSLDPLEAELYKMLIESYFLTKVNINSTISASDIKEAKAIVFTNSTKESQILSTYQKIIELKEKTLIVYMNEDNQNLLKYRTGRLNYFQPYQFDELVEKIKPLNIIKRATEAYVPISTQCIEILEKIPCDVYNKSGIKFELVIKENETFNKIKKVINTLYISRKDYITFSDYFIECYTNHKINKQEKQKVLIEVIHQRMRSVGIDNEILTKTDQILDEVIQELGANKILGKQVTEVLSKFLKKQSFVPEHSLMCAYLTNAMLNQSGYATDQLRKKLSLAAIFHDLSLGNKLATVEFSAIPLESFCKEEQQKYLKHHQSVVKVLAQFSMFDNDLEKLVKYHHELPDESGPFKINSHNIPLLSAIFNVAHYYSINLYNLGIHKSSEIINQMELFFNSGQYAKAFAWLKESVSEGEESLKISA